jgi:ubiquinone/menaquinone biosynthesis C-methylase UbiE
VTLDDPSLIRREYADETRLATRKRAHQLAEGPDAREIVFAAVREARPNRILEVGCGEGELAERMLRELGANVVAVDQSERMVELTRARGVDARVGDVEQLGFEDSSFDSAVAAWMLFHAQDVDRALAELARVLRPGGRLVAATNGPDHLQELYELLGVPPLESRFDSVSGESALRSHFGSVERIDAYGWLVFSDRRAAQAYVDSLIRLSGCTVPALDGPIRVRRTPVVLVAERE